MLTFLADESAGIPRKALKWLRQVIDDGTWDLSVAKSLVGVLVDEDDPQIIDMCRKLNRGQFKDAVSIYDTIKNKGADAIRIPTALYFLACLKGARSVRDGDKFSEILEVLTPYVPESGKLGDMAMIHNLYKVCMIVRKYKK